MPSINLDLNYWNHPKTGRLVRLLGRGSEAIPVKLWCYCGRHFAETGVLTGIAAQEIESEVDWWGQPGKAVDALVQAGFLELRGDTFHVHDWLEHSGHLAVYRKRAKTAAKARWQKTPLFDLEEPPKNASSIENDASSNASSNAPVLLCISLIDKDPKEEEKIRVCGGEGSDASSIASSIKPTLPFNSPGFIEVWDGWVKYRKERKKPLTPSTIKKQFKKCVTMGEAESIAAIEEAIEKSWSSFFQKENRAADRREEGYEKVIREHEESARNNGEAK